MVRQKLLAVSNKQQTLKDPTIKSKGQLAGAASELILYIKDPNSDQEVELDEDLLEKNENFSNLVRIFGVNSKNPIIVREPSGTYILQTCKREHGGDKE